jgi:osmotically inducible protein OsmC
MSKRTAEALWQGQLRDGSGMMKVGSGFIEGPYTFASRFESGKGTNPEELIGAAHAGCFSMFLAGVLGSNGYAPESVHTTVTVHLERDDVGPLITLIELDTEATVPGLTDEVYQGFVQTAKANCPISRVLAATQIVIKSATLKG